MGLCRHHENAKILSTYKSKALTNCNGGELGLETQEVEGTGINMCVGLEESKQCFAACVVAGRALSFEYTKGGANEGECRCYAEEIPANWIDDNAYNDWNYDVYVCEDIPPGVVIPGRKPYELIPAHLLPDEMKQPECTCIGLPDLLIANETLRKGYPTTYGESCYAHDFDTSACSNETHRPGWCYDSWCYVNPDGACGKSSSTYFPGYNLFYSYSHCGAMDSFSAEHCGKRTESGTCIATAGDICAWNDGVCQAKNCQCLGNEFLSPAELLEFGQHYGDSCSNWDQDHCPIWEARNESALGLWCCQAWCYVDPSCPSAHASVLHEGRAYSYYACPDDKEELVNCPWGDAIGFGETIDGENAPLTDLTGPEVQALDNLDFVPTPPNHAGDGVVLGQVVAGDTSTR
jgi:hypothetical protein